MDHNARTRRARARLAGLAACVLLGSCTTAESEASPDTAANDPAPTSVSDDGTPNALTDVPVDESVTVEAATPYPVGSAFTSTFTGDVGLADFDTGIFHRDVPVTGQVSADHDLSCGSPDTQRTVDAQFADESFYMCKDHMMTAIGNWSGYSTGWFTPRMTFEDATTVSWDVNVTNLGSRQWWEVMIVDASFDSGFPECPQCAVTDFLTPDPSHLPPYPDGAIVVGNGAFGNDVNIWHDGPRYSGWQHTCGESHELFESLPDDPCHTKPPRLSFSIQENGNGTITVDYGGVYTETFDGQFPERFHVVFKDHNYVPDKDGEPIGHTWHWDNIVVG